MQEQIERDKKYWIGRVYFDIGGPIYESQLGKKNFDLLTTAGGGVIHIC